MDVAETSGVTVNDVALGVCQGRGTWSGTTGRHLQSAATPADVAAPSRHLRIPPDSRRSRQAISVSTAAGTLSASRPCASVGTVSGDRPAHRARAVHGVAGAAPTTSARARSRRASSRAGRERDRRRYTLPRGLIPAARTRRGPQVPKREPHADPPSTAAISRLDDSIRPVLRARPQHAAAPP